MQRRVGEDGVEPADEGQASPSMTSASSRGRGGGDLLGAGIDADHAGALGDAVR